MGDAEKEQQPELANVLRGALVDADKMTRERWERNVEASWELDD